MFYSQKESTHNKVRYCQKGEYYLSEKGLSLMPVIQTICQWGHEHINDPVSE